MLNIYVSKPFQQSKQSSIFKLNATHFNRCLCNCAQIDPPPSVLSPTIYVSYLQMQNATPW
jgi:hypothetical protein